MRFSRRERTGSTESGRKAAGKERLLSSALLSWMMASFHCSGICEMDNDGLMRSTNATFRCIVETVKDVEYALFSDEDIGPISGLGGKLQ